MLKRGIEFRVCIYLPLCPSVSRAINLYVSTDQASERACSGAQCSVSIWSFHIVLIARWITGKGLWTHLLWAHLVPTAPPLIVQYHLHCPGGFVLQVIPVTPASEVMKLYFPWSPQIWMVWICDCKVISLNLRCLVLLWHAWRQYFTICHIFQCTKKYSTIFAIFKCILTKE